MDLINLAILFRSINIYSHHAHNMTKGETFLQDHAFFGEIYGMMDGFYDDLIERHIGTVDDKVDLSDIMERSVHMIKTADMDFFPTIKASLENALSKIENLCKNGLSQGTMNMLQGQADQIEVLIYKLKRRMMEDED